MSYIENPEQIWPNSMSVWSCSPSVPAVVEVLVLISREQKWNMNETKTPKYLPD